MNKFGELVCWIFGVDPKSFEPIAPVELTDLDKVNAARPVLDNVLGQLGLSTTRVFALVEEKAEENESLAQLAYELANIRREVATEQYEEAIKPFALKLEVEMKHAQRVENMGDDAMKVAEEARASLAFMYPAKEEETEPEVPASPAE